MCAWQKVETEAEFKGNLTKIFQAAADPHIKFLRKLTNGIHRKVKCKEKWLLIKLLVFENTSKDYQAIYVLLKRKNIMGYLQACKTSDYFS